MSTKKLTPSVIEKLGYYVYLYINPLTDSIFYVGKRKGGRVLSHLNDESDSNKAQMVLVSSWYYLQYAQFRRFTGPEPMGVCRAARRECDTR